MRTKSTRLQAKKWVRFFKVWVALFIGICTIINLDNKTREAKAQPLISGYIETITPTPTQAPVSWVTITNEIIDTFKDKGKKVTVEAIQIAYCESKLEEHAYNWNNPTDTRDASEDKGIFQFNSVHNFPDSIVYNYKANIAKAKLMYERQGWRPWVCARTLGIIN